MTSLAPTSRATASAVCHVLEFCSTHAGTVADTRSSCSAMTACCASGSHPGIDARGFMSHIGRYKCAAGPVQGTVVHMSVMFGACTIATWPAVLTAST